MLLNQLRAWLPEIQSIRSRLLLNLGIVFVAGMVALYLAATSYARYAADSSFDRLLLGSAGSIAETLSITPGEIRADIPYSALDMLSAAPDDRVFYRVVGTNGATVTGYSDLPSDPLPRSGSAALQPVRFFDALYRDETIRFVLLGREVRIAGQSGWVWVQVGQTRGARSMLARDLTIRALIPILALTVLAVCVAWFSIGRAMQPLKMIGGNLSARSSSDLSPIVSPVPTEIAPLVGAVNSFMARLDNNMDVLRNFIATAAHQLRTPLTALLVQIRSAELANGATQAASIDAASQSATRLARLVDQLLSDAMVTHRAEERHTNSFDLKRVIEQALHDTLPISGDADVRFTTALKSASMIGDAVMFAEAIKNLVHNALMHGNPEGHDEHLIQIDLRSKGDFFELSIADSGTGMEDAALLTVGDRFSTGQPGRQGSGLGLAIVKQVVISHNGTLRVENRREGGLRVLIAVPMTC